MTRHPELPHRVKQLHVALDLAANGPVDPVTGRYLDQEYEERREERMLAWHGLRPSSATRVCPRYVLGKRCAAYGVGTTTNCLCHGHGLFDHARLWVGEQRQRVFTAEPYGIIDMAALIDVTERLEEAGLRVHLSAASPWFPARTILIKITKAD